MDDAPALEFDLESLCEDVSDDLLPPLDRVEVGRDVQVNEETSYWRDNGYLLLRGFIPDALIDPYVEYCETENIAPHGWREPCPFTHEPLMRDIACYKPLADKLEMLIGTPMGLSLALTGWRSSRRSWHQDDYLNPPNINCWYAASWISLADQDPDCGLFQYVPGSHKWPLIRGEKVRQALPSEKRDTPDWPLHSEAFIEPIFEKKIEETGSSVESFSAKKGDVLIWHGRLAHQGSKPKIEFAERKSLIAHYSAISKRADLPRHRKHADGGWYFLLEDSLSR